MSATTAVVGVGCLAVACVKNIDIGIIVLYGFLAIWSASKFVGNGTAATKLFRLLFIALLVYVIIAYFQRNNLLFPQPRDLIRMAAKTDRLECARCPAISWTVHKRLYDHFHRRTGNDFGRYRMMADKLWNRCYAGAGRWYEKALELDGAADVRTVLGLWLRGPFETALLPVLWPIVASYLAFDDETDIDNDNDDETVIRRPTIADAAYGAAAGRHATGDFEGALPFWRRSFRIYQAIDDAESMTTNDDETEPAVNIDGLIYPADIAPTGPIPIMFPFSPPKTAPTEFWIWSARGFLAAEDLKSAEQAADRAIRRNGGNDQSVLAEALLLQSAALTAAGRFNDAAPLIERGTVIAATIDARRTVPDEIEPIDYTNRFKRLRKQSTTADCITICNAKDLPGFRPSKCDRSVPR